jgi:hypothetical protein
MRGQRQSPDQRRRGLAAGEGSKGLLDLIDGARHAQRVPPGTGRAHFQAEISVAANDGWHWVRECADVMIRGTVTLWPVEWRLLQ